ncbi:MAG: LacI family DNA-binding transcriptional regulator [Pseudomonadota bacterium]
MKDRKPTIDDVATLAGVARVTVSRVLNGSGTVSAEVRERVARAVAELDYKVNVQARALASGRRQVVSFVFATDVEIEPNSFYQSGLELGALRACTEAGFQLLTQAINQNSPDPAARILDLVDQGACDGFILTPPFSDDAALLSSLVARNTPIACVSPGSATSELAPGVRMDDEAAGFDLTRYLLELGHRRFGFILGLERHVSAQERFAGFKRALAERGLSEADYVTVRGDFTVRSGVDLFPELAKARPRPTVVICGNDDMAIGAIFSSHRLGISVPGEMSIVGFDNTPISEVIWPPLTTVAQPLKLIGYKAANLVFRQMEEPSAVRGAEIVPHAIVERESAAAPPRAAPKTKRASDSQL